MTYQTIGLHHVLLCRVKTSLKAEKPFSGHRVFLKPHARTPRNAAEAWCPGLGFHRVAFKHLLRDMASCPGAWGLLATGQHEAFVPAARGGPEVNA